MPVNVGGVTSCVHVAVLDAVDVLPHSSIADQTLLCDLVQLLLCTGSSLTVIVGTPHASVAVAVPSALLISPADGLHPSVVPVPPVVSTGGVTSSVQVTVLAADAVLPQASCPVNVLVCVRTHPVL